MVSVCFPQLNFIDFLITVSIILIFFFNGDTEVSVAPMEFYFSQNHANNRDNRPKIPVLKLF